MSSMCVHLCVQGIVLLLTLFHVQNVASLLACDKSRRICYTAYTERVILNNASAACRERHPGGRLVTVLDVSTQTILDEALNGSGSTGISQYWLGTRVHYIPKWTWVNNVTFEGKTWLISTSEMSNVRGYTELRTEPNGALTLNIIQLNGSSQDTHERHALCQCLTVCDDSERYTLTQASRWNAARNICSKRKGWDLAVLSDDNIQDIRKMLVNNSWYFVGLTNVRQSWYMTELDEIFGTFTNWYDDEPKDYRDGMCVFADRSRNWKWSTSNCGISNVRPFICEHVMLDRNEATEMTADAEQSSSPTPESTQSVASFLWLVIPAILFGAVIAISIISHCRRRQSAQNAEKQRCSVESELIDTDLLYAEIDDDANKDLMYSEIDESVRPTRNYNSLNPNHGTTPDEVSGVPAVYDEIGETVGTPVNDSSLSANPGSLADEDYAGQPLYSEIDETVRPTQNDSSLYPNTGRHPDEVAGATAAHSEVNTTVRPSLNDSSLHANPGTLPDEGAQPLHSQVNNGGLLNDYVV